MREELQKGDKSLTHMAFKIHYTGNLLLVQYSASVSCTVRNINNSWGADMIKFFKLLQAKVSFPYCLKIRQKTVLLTLSESIEIKYETEMG